MITGMRHNREKLRNHNRSAFTLMEMLVVITIMLIIFSMTAGVVALAINTDRIPSSSRTIQAALLGARDRAVRAGRDDLNQQPRRGVRFVTNPNLPNTINSLVYIGSQDDWTDGQVTVTAPRTIAPTNPWPSSFSNPYLVGTRIKITEGSNSTWYRLADAGTLTRDYVGAAGTYSYILRLPAEILPNEQPLPLDSNVVIDLNRSEVPSGWNQEILFTPNGSVSGPMSAQGALYLYLCSVDDVLNGYGPADTKSGDKLAIKINLQTGQVQSFPVNPDNANPFKFAKQ